MRILIADDHDLVREMMAAYLERDGGMQVIQCASFEEAMGEMVRNGPFELVLLDFRMPGMRGLEGLREAIEAAGGNPVALISGSADKSVAEEALAAGAAGFLPKTMSARSMTNAVKFMSMGETFVPVDFMTAKEVENPALAHLTPRERQVLEGISKGKSNKEIALDHDIQEVTVKLHVKTLCRKMGAKNRTQAAMMARDQEMV
ncbi:DNA-binding NarL/FixJ family response regulator [Limimaricola variabilis]|jgi:DNA-binding NarL/FixJ family response regulator|uniref:DNA-binding NarL/FixJ family response regulator n=1 Tax=Limimaricola variabilis TaxID=1492771 RepID=A0ABR6HNN8_9RHOB|nr:response regulator transcription factor [Limimaricola variabilis]MBB3712048.1 DNA-binding NarL/FixJ family response regulator [Limimaricola variabilis]WPY93124.1 response regulator transcription factor [Limimaricola variabilis]